METFSKTVQDFLNELSHFTGRAPVISIDYGHKELVLVDAPSGFIKQLSLDDRWVLSLAFGKGILVSKFS